jgi:hypothetical protein
MSRVFMPASDLVRRAALGGGLLCAFVLLVVFYTTVAGAVERAAVRHMTPADPVDAAAVAQRPSARLTAAVAPQSAIRTIGTRAVSYTQPTP